MIKLVASGNCVRICVRLGGGEIKIPNIDYIASLMLAGGDG
jgi:hypothetical protein